jgi:hypothetical protein
MSRGWFLKSCRDYSTKFNSRLRTVRVNFVRTHHVRRIKAYDQQPQILLSRVLCPSVRGNQRKRYFYRVGQENTRKTCRLVRPFLTNLTVKLFKMTPRRVILKIIAPCNYKMTRLGVMLSD